MASADWVHTKGLGLALCSSRLARSRGPPRPPTAARPFGAKAAMAAGLGGSETVPSDRDYVAPIQKYTSNLYSRYGPAPSKVLIKRAKT
jgi:hypothetical protein